jgi:hypothetical protein
MRSFGANCRPSGSRRESQTLGGFQVGLSAEQFSHFVPSMTRGIGNRTGWRAERPGTSHDPAPVEPNEMQERGAKSAALEAYSAASSGGPTAV